MTEQSLQIPSANEVELVKRRRSMDVSLAASQIVIGIVLLVAALKMAGELYSLYTENTNLAGNKAAEAAQIAGLPMMESEVWLLRPDEPGLGAPTVPEPTSDRVTAASAWSAHYDAQAAFYGGFVLMFYAGAAAAVLIAAHGVRLWIRSDGPPFRPDAPPEDLESVSLILTLVLSGEPAGKGADGAGEVEGHRGLHEPRGVRGE